MVKSVLTFTRTPFQFDVQYGFSLWSRAVAQTAVTVRRLLISEIDTLLMKRTALYGFAVLCVGLLPLSCTRQPRGSMPLPSHRYQSINTDGSTTNIASDTEAIKELIFGDLGIDRDPSAIGTE